MYLAVFTMLWAAAFGQVAVVIPEAYEVARDEAKTYHSGGPQGLVCGTLPTDRAYRILARGVVSGLPMLVTLTIFLFPALYKP